MIVEFIKATKQQTYKKYKKILYNEAFYKGYNHASLTEFDEKLDSDIEQMAINAFKKTIYTIRQRKNKRNKIKNPIGLFVAILRDLVKDRYNDL